ncbi:MAG TPA: RecQ family ATP-dependent DNA helicase [Thermoanaerobaculia bacterium]|nr:RecQ family ATP-dependent DNA helicase [Thermoanaerobaculia bacterium]
MTMNETHPLSATDVLRQTFGFDAFRPGQEEVVGHLLAGRSAAAVFPTGAGKSLCFQLPALLLPGLTLVVSPLIALMKDQIDQLKARGIDAERLDSTLSAEEHGAIMSAVRAGSLRLLYVAPERFNNERFREAMRRVRISLFAVDEAHCVSEWGHNFRPDYLKLAAFGRLCGAERVLALTATATPQVLDDICRGFEIDPASAVRTGFYRPNLTLLTTPMEPERRDDELCQRLAHRGEGTGGPAIVYVTQQRTAEEVADILARAGLDARAYHAGLEDDERSRVQDWFLRSDRAVVVATIAFGMGIDKPDIRTVIHYNLPKSLENLSQEIGRAGRDGLPSRCEIFVSPGDLRVLRNFAYGDTPEPAAVRGLLDEIAAGPDTLELNLQDLSAAHDVRLLVVRTLLTYLEIDGYLEAGTPTWSQYQFQALESSEQILARFEGERRDFLHSLFAQAKKAKTWYHIDLDEAAAALGSPRDRLVRALDWLGEQKLLEVRSAGLRYRYRWLRRPQDLDGLAESLHRRTLEREEREIARLDQVLELAAHDGCQTAFLCAHFGETLPHPCGHCSWCLRGGPMAIPPEPPWRIDEAFWRQAEGVRRERAADLASPRAFARFLTGLPSPRLTRAKLGRHPFFGALSDVPFPEVLRRAEGE